MILQTCIISSSAYLCDDLLSCRLVSSRIGDEHSNGKLPCIGHRNEPYVIRRMSDPIVHIRSPGLVSHARPFGKIALKPLRWNRRPHPLQQQFRMLRRQWRMIAYPAKQLNRPLRFKPVPVLESHLAMQRPLSVLQINERYATEMMLGQVPIGTVLQDMESLRVKLTPQVVGP